MDTLRQNVRFAVCSLRKSPAPTLSVVLTPALCIGAVTAIFSVVYTAALLPAGRAAMTDPMTVLRNE